MAAVQLGADVQRTQVREGPLQPRREVGGLDRRMGAVELLVMDELGAGLGQALVLLRAGEDQRDGRRRPQHLARVRFVGQHADQPAVGPGRGAGGTQHGPMAEMHAVEGADGEVERGGHVAAVASATGMSAACSWASSIAPSCGKVRAWATSSRPERVRRSIERWAPGPSLRPRS